MSCAVCCTRAELSRPISSGDTPHIPRHPPHDADQTPAYSYEALPPNFSLAQNMAAGAFAGIAVGLRLPARALSLSLCVRTRGRSVLTAMPTGTYYHVSDRCSQGSPPTRPGPPSPLSKKLCLIRARPRLTDAL
jgi:hypothetical protein